jgi:IS5 family transposase
MKPKSIKNDQNKLFEARLSEILNPREAIFALSDIIPWHWFDQEFSVHFVGYNGQPPKPIRLMVGLLILQHTEKLSDEAVVEKWKQNPYWQYFCGYDHFQWDFPADGSSLVRFRKRIGTEGMDKILSVTVKIALGVKAVKAKDLKQVIVDTTVMETNVKYPTDSESLNKIRHQLVKKAKAASITLRQTYERTGKALVRKIGGYAHAKQFKRMNKGVKRLKTILGRTVRDIERKIAGNSALLEQFQFLLELAKRLMLQSKNSKDKVYSIHAPHTCCISKGKAHKRYEFGNKVSLVITHKQGLALSCRALENAPFDGHTLKSSLEHAQNLTNTAISQAFVDRGYKGHGVTEQEVYISGQKRGMTPALKRQLKRRSAIEPHIGHMKSDGRLHRSMLKGFLGDQFNAILCAVGHNMRFLLRYLNGFLHTFIQLVLMTLQKMHNALEFENSNSNKPL